MDADRLAELLEAYLLGEAGPDQCAELAQALRADASHRRRLTEQALLEVHLYQVYSEARAAGKVLRAPAGLAEAPAPVRQARRTLPRRWLAGAAAVALATIAGLAYLVARPGRPEGNLVVRGQVLVEGQSRRRIPPGATIEVGGQAGATVRLADGSEVSLDPASRAVLRGPVGDARQVVELRRGGGQFSVPPGKGRFRVETGVGEVTVLGTEFTVRLGSGERATMSVAVASGQVRVDWAGGKVVLSAGQSQVFVEGPPEPREDPEHRAGAGLVQAVDLARRTIALIGEEAARRTFRLADDAEVVIDGAGAGLEQLRAGMQVVLTLTDDRQLASRIEARGLAVHGPVKAVGPGGGSLTLIVGKEKAKDQVFDLSPGTRVIIDGRTATAGEIREGMRATLQLSADGSSVLEVRIGRGKEGER